MRSRAARAPHRAVVELFRANVRVDAVTPDAPARAMRTARPRAPCPQLAQLRKQDAKITRRGWRTVMRKWSKTCGGKMRNLKREMIGACLVGAGFLGLSGGSVQERVVCDSAELRLPHPFGLSSECLESQPFVVI